MQVSAYPYHPVRERGTSICFLAALFMHMLLGALLYYGVRWHSAAPEGISAELWEPIAEAVPNEPAVEPAAEPTPSAKPVEEETADISLQEQRRKVERAARDEAKAQREKQARVEAERKAAQREAQRDAMEAQRQAGNAQRQSELARLRAQAGGTNRMPAPVPPASLPPAMPSASGSGSNRTLFSMRTSAAIRRPW